MMIGVKRTGALVSDLMGGGDIPLVNWGAVSNVVIRKTLVAQNCPANCVRISYLFSPSPYLNPWVLSQLLHNVDARNPVKYILVIRSNHIGTIVC